KLKLEVDGVNVDVTPFNHLLGSTKVGELIANLSHTTNPTTIDTLATLSEAEILRIAELKAVLSEADPKAKAQEFKLSAGRIKDVATRVDVAFRWVKDETVAKLKTICNDVLLSEEAEKAAALVLQSGEKLLPGTGEQAWKSLFEAARKFSTEVAYHGHSFPYTDNGAVCPLCQQLLADADERLKRLEKYIQDDAAKVANEKRQLLNDARMRIERADVTIVLSNPLKAELSQLETTAVSAITAFEGSIESRHLWMLNAVVSHCWDSMPQLSENPCGILRGLAARQLRATRAFNKASNEAKKKELINEYNQLVARQNLKTSLQPILELLNRMKSKASLEKCYNDLDTKPISKQSKKLAKDVITLDLKKAIDKEFQTLDIGHIDTKLKHRTTRAKNQYTLLLDLPTTTKLEAILSEGEQRAIALGSFLAELQLANHKGAIVFDDPVSSLDHYRRIRVAERLVGEAKHRQVIIFTHDTVFLGELLDQLDQKGVAHLIHHLEWANDIPGDVCEGLPWGHQGYKERLNTLDQACSKIAKNWPTHPNENDRIKIRRQYGLLRATIERVIQDVIFNGVVKRYRDWIRVDGLNGIVGVAEVNCKEIQRLHKQCCDVTEAHDPSSAKNATIPTPRELGDDITALVAVIQAIKDSRKSPAGVKPPPTP
ncbi:AAA family ATPase, partial [Candidatus Pacearchaeota archaeon]|nr:AAA family ATPase [Candidatus Pacearchaeota archaeon]